MSLRQEGEFEAAGISLNKSQLGLKGSAIAVKA